MHYPVLENRLFNRSALYGEIDWNNLPVVIDAWEERMREWYIEPALQLEKASSHFGFAVMALNSILIDALSQYYAGQQSSSQTVFKDFLRAQIPEFAQQLPSAIRYQFNNNNRSCNDYADVFYAGMRCGIVHEAHPSLYCAISGQGQMITLYPDGLTTYQDNHAPCPTIVFDPYRVRDRIHQVFDQYLLDLRAKNPSFDNLRDKFKQKFMGSFGIRIEGTSHFRLLCAKVRISFRRLFH